MLQKRPKPVIFSQTDSQVVLKNEVFHNFFNQQEKCNSFFLTWKKGKINSGKKRWKDWKKFEKWKLVGFGKQTMEQGKQFYLSQDSQTDWYFHNSWNFNDSEKCCIFGQNLLKNNNRKKTRRDIFLEFKVKKRWNLTNFQHLFCCKLKSWQSIVKKNKNHLKPMFEADVWKFSFFSGWSFFSSFLNLPEKATIFSVKKRWNTPKVSEKWNGEIPTQWPFEQGKKFFHASKPSESSNF